MPDLERRSQGLGQNPALVVVDVINGFTDPACPLGSESDDVVAALRRTGTPHVYHLYEGEGHGWRKQETIDHFYRAVESFLEQHVLMQ